MGVFLVKGWGSNCLVCLSKPRNKRKNFFDILGKSSGHPRVPAKFENKKLVKKFVFNFCPLRLSSPSQGASSLGGYPTSALRLCFATTPPAPAATDLSQILSSKCLHSMVYLLKCVRLLCPWLACLLCLSRVIMSKLKKMQAAHGLPFSHQNQAVEPTHVTNNRISIASIAHLVLDRSLSLSPPRMG